MVLDITKISDSRGDLYVAEYLKDIPFDIKRIYFIKSVNDEPRGFHAHRQLNQAAICIQGSCEMILDDGSTKEKIKMDAPNKMVMVDKMVWHEMHDFSKDCILLVMASDVYNENDYIRNYQEFKEEVK